LRQAYGKHPSADWIANLTGGTKPMSIATYEFFKALEGRLVYTNVASPAELMDIATREGKLATIAWPSRSFWPATDSSPANRRQRFKKRKLARSDGGNVRA